VRRAAGSEDADGHQGQQPVGRLAAGLHGVPETTLWTLYHRAREASRPGSPLRDPKAIELAAAIDLDFRGRFGTWPPGLSRFVGLRALAFDAQVRPFLDAVPDAVVVSLGEGLETQFWRVDNGRVRWLTVELPPVAALRSALVPEDPPRRRVFAGSVCDPDWFAAVGERPGDRVFVVAQGLLMYLRPEQVTTLITRCATRFGNGVMVFDTVPRWFARLAGTGRLRGPGGYLVPRMPWGVTPGRLLDELRLDPDVAAARLIDPPPVGGLAPAVVLRARGAFPALRDHGPAIVRVEFSD